MVDNYHSLKYALDIDTTPKKHTLPFIRGEDMIEICFIEANRRNTPLILQKFFRPDGYDKYSDMLKQYPKVSTDISSFDIWKIEEFPEYEKNFIFALKYIKNILDDRDCSNEE